MINTEKATSIDSIGAVAALAQEIWHECFKNIISEAQIDYMLRKFLSPDAIRVQTQLDGYTYYLVYNALERRRLREPIGFLAIKPEGGSLFLSKLYLKSGERGKGFGGEMLDFVCGMAVGMGAKAVWLTVNKHNAQAIEVYRKKGFVIIREQVSDIGEGFVMDDFVFEKRV